MYKKYVCWIFTSLVFCLIVSGCSDITSVPDSHPDYSSKLTIRFTLPDATLPTKNQLGAGYQPNESGISDFDLLFFNTADQKFTDHFVIDEFKSTSGAGYFMSQVPAGKYDIVVMANARSEIQKALTDIKPGSITKEELLQKIVANHSGKWDVRDYIPMWAEKPGLEIDANSTANTVQVGLLRMLAKINISMNDDLKDKFVLQEAWLYNYNTSGVIACTHFSGDKATDVTIPDDPKQEKGPAGPYQVDKNGAILDSIYTFEKKNVGDDAINRQCLVIGGKYGNRSQESFYRMDFVTPGDKGLQSVDILRNCNYYFQISDVLGYGKPDKDAAFEVNPQVNPLKYTVIKWDNRTIHYLQTDGKHILGITTNDVKLTGDMYNENTGMDNLLGIITDDPSGWILTVDSKDSGWLSLNHKKEIKGNTSSDQSEVTYANICVTSNSDAKSVERTGTIHVATVNHSISFDMKVTQSNKTGFDFRLEAVRIDKNGQQIGQFDSIPDGTIFDYSGNPNGYPGGYKLRVAWLPTANECKVDRITQDGLTPFNFNGKDGFRLDQVDNLSTDIKQPLTITCPNLTEDEVVRNPFLEKNTKITFTIDDGSGNKKSRTITFRQQHNGLSTKNVPTTVFIGGESEFQVVGNVSWALAVDDPDNALDKSFPMKTSGGQANVYSEENFDFKLADGAHEGSQIIFHFKSPDQQTDYADVILQVVDPSKQTTEDNTIIVEPGRSVDIPITKAYEMWKKLNNEDIGENNNGAKLLWQDSVRVVGQPGLIRSVQYIARKPVQNSVIRVQTDASYQGNAVICFTQGTGTVRWSWLLWVTTYNPNMKAGQILHKDPAGTGTADLWMDRDIGALNNGKDANGNIHITPRSFGLMFQNGRNAPMPSRRSLSEDLPHLIYDINGNDVTSMYDKAYRSGGRLGDLSVVSQVQNPDKYDVSYWNSSGSYNAMVNNWTIGGLGNQPGSMNPCPTSTVWFASYKGGYQSFIDWTEKEKHTNIHNGYTLWPYVDVDGVEKYDVYVHGQGYVRDKWHTWGQYYSTQYIADYSGWVTAEFADTYCPLMMVIENNEVKMRTDHDPGLSGDDLSHAYPFRCTRKMNY